MIRIVSIPLALMAVVCLVGSPAEARKKSDTKHSSKSDSDSKSSDKKSADKAGSGKPVQVGTYGDWGAYLAKGKNKTCYALASPKDRKPDGKREAAYVFIADRPGEKVHNEVSIIMGVPMKENAPATAKIGSASYDLIAKGSNAWIKNVDDEPKFVEALRHGGKLVVKAPPAKGPAITDTYSLSGLKDALDRVGKDCK